jgi:uncharacterized lipoprotein
MNGFGVYFFIMDLNQTGSNNAMKKIAQSLMVAAAVLVAAACAYSPQQLNVQPAITVTGEAFGNGRPIMVTASDQRQDRVLGKVGGLYGATTTISIVNDLESAMVRATNGLLAAYGFVVNSPDSSAVQLTVVIDEIRYEDQSQDKLGKDVKMTAALRAEALKGGANFSGRYQTNAQYRSVTTPDAKDNEQRVNALLEQTLVRMFQDPKLRDFLLN